LPLFSRLADVDVFPLPIRLPDLLVQQFWHARYNNDAGHRWFRSLVAQTLRRSELRIVKHYQPPTETRWRLPVLFIEN
jgi:hypothetical protein